jgi:hypothetical protein
VTELSRTSITVRSSDGYTQRYAVGSATLGDGGEKGTPSLSKNEQIVVIALRGSGDPVAQRVFSTAGH